MDPNDYFCNELNITHSSNDYIIVNEDALSFLRKTKSEIADIVFLDPPFNLKKKYTADKSKDNLSEDEYKEFIKLLIYESSRVLKQGGALYLYHIPKWAAIFTNFLNEVLDFRHWISISMKNGYPRKGYLYPAHYALLYYSKGKPLYFNRPKLPLEKCRHCSGLIKDYGGYKKYIEDGVNLSDVWTDLSPVRHKKYKNRIANELPEKMLDRIISISGKSDLLLIDPFAGSGTSGVCANKVGMKSIMCDRSSEYLDVIKTRIME